MRQCRVRVSLLEEPVLLSLCRPNIDHVGGGKRQREVRGCGRGKVSRGGWGGGGRSGGGGGV